MGKKKGKRDKETRSIGEARRKLGHCRVANKSPEEKGFKYNRESDVVYLVEMKWLDEERSRSE